MKIEHAIDFLCEDMKIKVTLKFRGREMAHTEYGFQVVQKFLGEIQAFGHQDFEPKLIGRGINVMISPLPRNKRARNPRQVEGGNGQAEEPAVQPETEPQPAPAVQVIRPSAPEAQPQPEPQAQTSKPGAFTNNPFTALEIK